MRLLKNFGCAVLCLVVYLASGDHAFGQIIIPKADSIAMRGNIEGFYSWYLGLIKDGRLAADFNPLIVKKKDGMTTLDFTNYQNGLRKYGFADDFIKQKTKANDECVSNLSAIRYDSVLTFNEQDNFDMIVCSFNNTYEWLGGNPDPVDRVSLSMLQLIDKKTIEGQLDFFDADSSTAGGAMITFRKIGKDWKITEVGL